MEKVKEFFPKEYVKNVRKEIFKYADEIDTEDITAFSHGFSMALGIFVEKDNDEGREFDGLPVVDAFAEAYKTYRYVFCLKKLNDFIDKVFK